MDLARDGDLLFLAETGTRVAGITEEKIVNTIQPDSIGAFCTHDKVHLPGASTGPLAGLTFAAVSNTCMMGNMLSKLPYNRSAGEGPGTDEVVAALVAERPAP